MGHPLGFPWNTQDLAWCPSGVRKIPLGPMGSPVGCRPWDAEVRARGRVALTELHKKTHQYIERSCNETAVRKMRVEAPTGGRCTVSFAGCCTGRQSVLQKRS